MNAYDPRSQCGVKIPFANKKAAKRRATLIESQIGARLRAYHCPCCGWYHLGNSTAATIRRGNRIRNQIERQST